MHDRFGSDSDVTEDAARQQSRTIDLAFTKSRGRGHEAADAAEAGSLGEVVVYFRRLRPKRLVIGGEALLAEQLAFWRQHAPSTRLINERFGRSRPLTSWRPVRGVDKLQGESI